MALKLPKRLRGFSYDRVMPVEMNTFDVDILLPAFFFQVVSGGKDRGRIANDSERINEYVQALAHHESVTGFDHPSDMRTLERLVKTSLVQMGRKGQSGNRLQMMGLTGYTFLAFKPGLPAESSSLRKVPSLLYRMMRDQLRGEQKCREFFENIFGRGVDIQGNPEPDGRYNGTEELDTLTRLSLAFLDGFKPTGVRNPKEQIPPEPCLALADRMAIDLSRYLETYRDRMPIEALTYNLRALINFELLIYTLKLIHGITELVSNPEDLPYALCSTFSPSPPEIYVDFTTRATGPSRDMSANCIRRDLDAIQRFIAANLTLRQLDRYVRELRTSRRVGPIINQTIRKEQKGPEYLQGLLELLAHPDVAGDIDASARKDQQDIRDENAPADREEGEEFENEEIDLLLVDADSDFEATVRLLVEAQRAQYTKSITQWFYSIGGILKPHGLLRGSTKSRQSWRYAPTNDLLAALVQLAAVQGPKCKKESPAPHLISLRGFLEWLDERFGILVDTPPDGFSGAEYTAAAQENLRAMQRRLQQMGIFRDLSDDFTVQRLTPPYAESAVQAVS